MTIFFAITGGMFLFGTGAFLALISWFRFREVKEERDYQTFKGRMTGNLYSIIRWCGHEYPQIKFFANHLLAAYRDGVLIDAGSFREECRKGKWLEGYKDGFHQSFCDSLTKSGKACNCDFIQ